MGLRAGRGRGVDGFRGGVVLMMLVFGWDWD